MEQQITGTTVGGGYIPAPATPAVDQEPERRPGVPREHEPRPAEGAHWRVPDRQPMRRGQLKRKGLDEITPVFGTAQPPRGLSGLLRRLAYAMPEHQVRHWALLLTADRIDILEGRLGDLMARPLRDTRLDRVGRFVQRHPLPILGVAAGAVALLNAARR